MHLDEAKERFWSEEFENLCGWKPQKVWTKVSQGLTQQDQYSEAVNPLGKWFEGAVVNARELCIERHIDQSNLSKVALYEINSENRTIYNATYLELHEKTLAAELLLRESLADSSKKSVFIVASHGIDTSILMLACLFADIHFSVCFHDIGEIALRRRIDMLNPDIIIFIDGENALCRDANVEEVLDGKYSALEIRFQGVLRKKHVVMRRRDLSRSSVVRDESMFTLFTSGSTGTPKAITHSKAGYLVYANWTCKYFWDLDIDDVIFTAADAGWINGHTYALFGPLLRGSTSVVTDCPASLINQQWLEHALTECDVSALYLPVSLLRLMKATNQISSATLNISEKRIRKIGSMGEPLAPIVRQWYGQVFLTSEKCPVINTYFQTETGGILVAQRSVDHFQSNGSAIGKIPPALDIVADNGELKVKSPWPGSAIGFLGEHESIAKYFDQNGFYRLNDTGTIDCESTLFVGGRTDDVIIVQGKNISACEIEAALLESTSKISECAVFPVVLSDQATLICACLVESSCSNPLNSSDKDYMRQYVYAACSIPILVKRFYTCQNLPKNKSGKIMRSLLRLSAEQACDSADTRSYPGKSITVLHDGYAINLKSV